MKKLGAIALLAIFLFNTAGYYVVFLAEQMQIKSEIRSQINAGYYNENFTSIITINRAQLSTVEFFDDGQEFLYKGKMYDVAKRSTNGNDITFYCINDSKEQNLMAALDDHINTHVAANKPLKNNDTKKLSDNVVKIYFTSISTFNFTQSSNATPFATADEPCLPAELKKSTPPPPEFC